MKSWRTTLMGFLAAVSQAYMGGMNWKSIAASTPTLLLGLMAKDTQVTGAAPILPEK